jgi:hypothetical protein
MQNKVVVVQTAAMFNEDSRIENDDDGKDAFLFLRVKRSQFEVALSL